MRFPSVLVLIPVIGLTGLTGCGDEPEPELQTPPPALEAPADTPVDSPAPALEDPDPLAPGPSRAGADAGTDAGAGEAADPDAVRTTQPLYTVQVAAFTNRESAELWRDRLGDQGLPVWTAVSEVGGRTFYRVRVGAVPTVTEARRLGSMLTARYDWPVWIAPLGPADPVPAGAVDRTRRAIAAG